MMQHGKTSTGYLCHFVLTKVSGGLKRYLLLLYSILFLLGITSEATSQLVKRTMPDGREAWVYHYNSNGIQKDTNELKNIVFQKDTSQPKGAIRADAKGGNKKGGGMSTMMFDNPLNSCYMNGDQYPIAGQSSMYTLYCNEIVRGSVYWVIYPWGCVTNSPWGNQTISVDWSSGCGGNMGSVEAYDEYFNYLAGVPVYIQNGTPDPLGGGSITSGTVNICQGASAGTITASSATGGDCSSSYYYQWQYSSDASTWYDITSANGQNHSPGAVYSTTYYRRKVICGSETQYTGYVAVNVTNPPSAFTISANGSTEVCYGSSVQLSTSNGASAYWYYGNDYITSGVSYVNVSSAGYYVAYVYNDCGYTQSSNTVTITNVFAPSVASISGGTEFCFGSGLQLYNATGGGSWSSSNSFIATVNSSGYVYSGGGTGSATIYYTVTNGCGFSTFVSQVVTVKTLPSPTIIGAAALACGQTISLGVSDPNFSSYDAYNWYNGSSEVIAYGPTVTVGPGSYRVNVSKNGCSNTSSWVSLTASSIPAAAISATKTNLCNGELTTISVNNYYDYSTFVWYKDGAYYATGSSSISVSGAGNYSCQAYNAYGCYSNSNFVYISTYTFAPYVHTNGGPSVICSSQGSVSLYASAGSSFQWRKDGSDISGATGSTYATASSGNYSVRAVDASGCVYVSGAASVTVNPMPSSSSISTSGPTAFCTGNSVTLSAPPGYSYLWSSGQTSQSVLVSSSSSLYVDITNSYNCTVRSATVGVSAYPLPSSTIITPSGSLEFCQGGNVGLTAPEGYAYLWSTGETSRTIYPSTSGAYTVELTNSYNCKATSAYSVVTVYPLPSTTYITASGNTSFCAGGSVTLSAPDGFSYLWSNGQTSRSINVTSSGTYSVQLTNGYNCSVNSSNSITVTVYSPPANPAVSASGNLTFCSGGAVTLAAPSGYSYLWNTGAQTRTVDITASGTYTVEITDGNGCKASSSGTAVTVHDKPAPSSIAVNGPTSFCSGSSTTLTAPDGYTYLWSTGATSRTINPGTSGSYAVTITNGNNCELTLDAVSITAHALPETPIISSSALAYCEGATPPALSVTSAGGGIRWFNSGSLMSDRTLFTESLGAGVYTVQVSNANNCWSAISDPVTISMLYPNTPGPITGESGLYVSQVSTYGNSISGGVWSVNNGNATVNSSTGVLTAVSEGTVQLTYTTTASNQCVASISRSITILSTPVLPAISGSNELCVNGTTAFTNAQTGGTWSSNATGIASIDGSGNVTAISAGTAQISYSYTHGNGFIQTVSKLITINALPTVAAIVGASSACINASIPLTNATPYGVWTSGNTAIATISSSGVVQTLSAGVVQFSYVVTNASSCSTTVIHDIEVLNSATPQSVSIVAAANYAREGSKLQFSSDASGGVWASSNTLVANVNTAGEINCLSPGVTNISYVVPNTCAAPSIATMLLTVSRAEMNAVNSVPVNGTMPAVAAPSLPQPYDTSIRLNYIRIREAVGPVADTATFRLASYETVKQITQYMDGLGRPLQTVAKQASPLGKDVVSPVFYDSAGRASRKYLPYTATDANGLFKIDPFPAQASFMEAAFPGEKVYFSTDIYEASPLNRVIQQMAPGNSWAGSNNGLQVLSRLNNVSDSVVVWRIGYDSLQYVDQVSGATVPTYRGVYAPGKLFKTQTVDEHGNSTVEFKDVTGKVILKKNLVDSVAGDGYSGWAATYYVYDDLGALRFVMQPKATQLARISGWTLTDSLINELCFRYDYDERNRMIAKKVPGAGWVYMVYDPRDRLAFTQDANMRSANQWLATLYDNMNRPVSTGMISYSGNRDELQTLLNTQFHSVQATTISVSFTGVGAGSLSNSSLALAYDPLPAGANYTALSWNYYDDYGFTTRTYTSSHVAKLDNGGNTHPETMPATHSKQTTGLATGSRIRILEDPDNLSTGKWMESVQYYDEKGRVVQSQADNHKGGQDIVSTRYDFTGKPVSVYEEHHFPAKPVLTTRTSTLYDHGGRVLHIRKQLNDADSLTRYLVRNQYDELGQLKIKRLGQRHAAMADSAMEFQRYDYNIRGWMEGLNKDYVHPESNVQRWFGMQLSYDHGFANAMLNGNIAGMRWRSGGDDQTRAYGFNYDRLNRLLFADFNEWQGSSWNRSQGIDFSMRMGDGIHHDSAYDVNGNILRMQQWGYKPGGSVQIDDLRYSYLKQGNKLKGVLDSYNDEHTGLGDFRTSALSPQRLVTQVEAKTDYSYDANGNMTMDLNKDIGADTLTGILYNHLNLPWKVQVMKAGGERKGEVVYIYDAAGTKLRKETREVGVDTAITDYMGARVYRNDTLQFAAHEEGRIRLADHAFVYDYFIRDHLGNTRVVLTEEEQVRQYPAVTLENGTVGFDSLYYRIDPNNIVYRPAALANAYVNNNTGWNTNPHVDAQANSEYVYRLNGTPGSRTGLGMVLRVMRGDTIRVMGKSYWEQVGSVAHNEEIPVSELLGALTGSGGYFNWKGIWVPTLNNLPFTPDALRDFLDSAPVNGMGPRAYINWVLLDDQFRPVSSSSGFDAVGSSSGELKFHDRVISAMKNGYLYVYCSNQSDLDVFFDNFQVIHKPGPLVEETHYYPFGLTMAGISSKAAGKLENRFKYNGIEQNTDLDLNQYDAFYRTLDPQIGRFWQTDPEVEALISYSPYESMGNNPVSYVDPLGNFRTRIGAWLYSLTHGGGTIGKNEFGEYYVSQATPTEVSDDGSVTVGVKIIYGKGRHAMSALGEKMIREANDQAYEDKMVDMGVWERHETVKDANEATFKNSVGVLLPNLVKGTTGLVNASPKINKIISRNLRLQKQINEHTAGGARLGSNSYLNSIDDASNVLNAAHSGEAKILSTNVGQNRVYVQCDNVTGYYNNKGVVVPTNKFLIKGGNSSTVVPIHPNTTKFK